MDEQQFDDFIREHYDSVMVNAFGKLDLTDEQRQAVYDEVYYWIYE